MVIHAVSDSVIRIKNASLARRRTVLLPYAKIVKEVAKILVAEGFLEDIKEEEKDGKKTLTATIRYQKRTALLSDVTIVSKPSLRVYMKANQLAKNRKRGAEILVFSTNKGILTEREAAKQEVGGELLFKIW